MKRMKATLLLLVLCYAAMAQNPAIDSFKSKLLKATTSSDKVELLSKLSRSYMSLNPAESDKYADQMTMEAELSRDRKLMVKALLVNADRHSYLSFRKENIDKSISFYNQAVDLAKKNDLEKDVAKGYLGLASIYSSIPELDKALNFTTQAFAIISTLKVDTLTVAGYNSYGKIYQLKKERILALRNYLSALRIAEESRNHTLLRSCYNNLSKFYADIKEYDKAIDYAQKALDELPLANPENEKYQRVIDLFTIGVLHMSKKNFTMSAHFYEKSIALADTLKYEQLKMPAYEGLLNQYLQADQPAKALEFLHQRKELKQHAANLNINYMIDGSYGIIHSQLGNHDSAQYYFSKAEPVYEKAGTLNYKLGFYYQYANYFKKSGNLDKAIEYYSKAKALADQSGNLEIQQMVVKELDTVNFRKGNFEQSYVYSNLYHQYKDSLNKLGEEKDLLQMELADEQQRQDRIQKEEEEALRSRHQLQYMGITIGIAVVFLLLVLLGIFQVSETTIRIMGFFAFILLFEFIILRADNAIHHWTHGEPLPILGIKIILIAILLPLHHWLEHRVVSYLASKRLIIPTGKSLLGILLPKRKTPVNH